MLIPFGNRRRGALGISKQTDDRMVEQVGDTMWGPQEMCTVSWFMTRVQWVYKQTTKMGTPALKPLITFM